MKPKWRQRLTTLPLFIYMIDSLLRQDKANQKKKQEEKFAFGTYAGGTSAGSVYTYRVKKQTAYGGYKIVTEVSIILSHSMEENSD